MNTLKLGFVTSLSVFLISACGGGASVDTHGAGSTVDAGNVVNIAATSGNHISSSGHNTKQLNFNTNLLVDSFTNTVSGTSKIYNYSNPQTGLMINQSDEIHLTADGQSIPLTESFSVNFGTSYAYELPIDASSYEFRYIRDGVLVSEGSLDSLPSSFGVSGVANGEEVSITVVKSANHTYEYNTESLMCKPNSDSSYKDVNTVYSLNGEGTLSGDYLKNINNVFGTSLADLQTNYETCYVEVYFSSESQNMNNHLSSKDISIFAVSNQIIKVDLY
jgi:hypothetical protein